MIYRVFVYWTDDNNFMQDLCMECAMSLQARGAYINLHEGYLSVRPNGNICEECKGVFDVETLPDSMGTHA
jgi:hypothetical protein